MVKPLSTSCRILEGCGYRQEWVGVTGSWRGCGQRTLASGLYSRCPQQCLTVQATLPTSPPPPPLLLQMWPKTHSLFTVALKTQALKQARKAHFPSG